MKRAPGAVVLPLLLLAACEESPVDCTTPDNVRIAAPISLEVAVADSLSGQSLVPGARGRWIAGALTDSLRTVGTSLVGYGLSGRTTLLVEAPGYHAWARSDILVRVEGCNVVKEDVLVRMQRLPPPLPSRIPAPR